MKGRIYEALFSVWCDGLEDPEERKEMRRATDAIGELFNADQKGKLSIEAEVSEVVCTSEKIAFIDGLRTGIGLASGRLFYDGLPGIN